MRLEYQVMSKAIYHLIFDLGGLFIDVYMDRFAADLQLLVGKEVKPTLEKLQNDKFFDAYETGHISTAAFLDTLAEAFGRNIGHEHYAACWNAILGQVQLEQLALIQPLRKHCDVVLLSNTNSLHVGALETDFEQRYPGEKLSGYFDRIFYSQEIGLRKPNADVFDFVVQTQAFNPANTLFIDDSPGHLLGAQALGIQTLLHKQNAPLLPTLQQAGLL